MGGRHQQNTTFRNLYVEEKVFYKVSPGLALCMSLSYYSLSHALTPITKGRAHLKGQLFSQEEVRPAGQISSVPYIHTYSTRPSNKRHRRGIWNQVGFGGTKDRVSFIGRQRLRQRTTGGGKVQQLPNPREVGNWSLGEYSK